MTQRIRIGYLVSQYPTAGHTFILREIVGLRELGYEVYVVTIRPDSRHVSALSHLEKLEREKSTSILPRWGFLVASNVRALFTRPAGYLRGVLEAVRLAGPDLIRLATHAVYFLEAAAAGSLFRRAGVRHVHTHFSSTVAVIAREIYGFDVSMTIHGPDEFRDVEGFGMRRKVAGSRFVIAISDYGRSQILRDVPAEYWDRVHVCRLGVDLGIFKPSYRRGPRNGEFVILCVARLTAVKAQRILIDAVASARQAGRHVTLRLVGDGPDRAALEAIVVSRGLGEVVRFEGVCSQERVQTLCMESDCFVLASFAEGIPVALMEAMASGVPCISTWVNGVPELIEHGVSGLLVPPGNVDELARAIVTLADSSALREELGAAAVQRVSERYDLGRNIGELARIHTKLGVPPGLSQ